MYANPQKTGSVLSGISRSGQCRRGKTWTSLRWSKICHRESPRSVKFTGNYSSTGSFGSIEKTNAPDGIRRIFKQKPAPVIVSILFRATLGGTHYFRKKGNSLSVTILPKPFGHSPFEPPGKLGESDRPTRCADSRASLQRLATCHPRSESQSLNSRLAAQTWRTRSMCRLQDHTCHFYSSKRHIQSMNRDQESFGPANPSVRKLCQN